MLEIPNFKTLEIRHIVCDYNGTIAKDGVVLPEIKTLFETLSKAYTLHVITADTHGSVIAQMRDYKCEVMILNSSDHTQEKADFIISLKADECAAMGNGNNDHAMLKTAAIGMAILGDEGCSKDTMFASDLICKSSIEALEMFLEPKRLIATLRR